MADIANSLPPGWDCKYDPRTSKYYFINHFTKQTTWEDPRLRYRPIHGTPTHVPVEHIPLQDLSNLRGMTRTSNGAAAAPGTPKTRETTLAQVPTDTEQAVGKISTMFPTVSETHIRLLMKKYMKSIFPSVDENVLLEVLGNNDNNVQKASEALKEMGFEKKEHKLLKPKSQSSTKRESTPKKSGESSHAAPATPKIVSQEEKEALKKKLHEKYRSIPERVVVLALESAEYNSSRAQQILDIVVQEETAIAVTISSAASTSAAAQEIGAIEQKKKEILQENVTPETGSYRSAYLLESLGPDSRLVKGSNNGMLLEDYVSWDGPDPRMRSGSAGLALGPNRSLLMGRSLAQGSNSALRKGPSRGLAQGSLYSQMQAITITESRGK